MGFHDAVAFCVGAFCGMLSVIVWFLRHKNVRVKHTTEVEVTDKEQSK